MRPFGWLVCTRCLFGVAGYWALNQIFNFSINQGIPVLSTVAYSIRGAGDMGTFLEIYFGMMLGEYIHEVYNFKFM